MDASKEMATVEGPKRTGKPVEERSWDTLTGKVLAWDEGTQQPVLLRMPGSPYNYIALFSSKKKLEELMKEAEVSYDKIKQISDGGEFMVGLMESGPAIAASTKVILDPHFTAEGRVRFTELILNLS